MSDYIKREDAIELLEDPPVHLSLGGMRVSDVIQGLGELPPADVVEVVRCKDCKHHEELLYNHDGKVLCWVHGLDVIVGRNGYCNYGERKEQEHE